jgi:hypothetical protein
MHPIKQGKVGEVEQGIGHEEDDKDFSAEAKVFTSNMVMVMGPTPPGTGVM